MPPKSVREKGVFSGKFPAWRSPKVSDTSPEVLVPNLMSVEPMSAEVPVVPYSAETKLPCRQVSSIAIESEIGGATSETVVLTVEDGCCNNIAWFSEKPCLFINGVSDGSFSLALIVLLDLISWLLLLVGCGVVVDVVVVEGCVGVCAIIFVVVVDMWPLVLLLLLVLLWGFLFSLSSWSPSDDPSASLSSCWYISSTMGFHKRTLALMNQFDTWNLNHTFNVILIFYAPLYNIVNISLTLLFSVLRLNVVCNWYISSIL